MSTQPDHIDGLIARYLAGEATPEQVAFLEEWKRETDANLGYFEHLKVIFERAPSAPAEPFDPDAAWEKVRSKISDRGRSVAFKSNAPDYKTFLRIAASVVLLVLASIFTYQFIISSKTRSLHFVTDHEIVSDTLPEGSAVVLNRQTTIEYTINEQKMNHTARLVGEAFFTISNDVEKTFIVEANGTLIRDIGTAFNVRAYPESNTVEVVVEEGEVIFYTKKNAGIHLRAQEKGVYNKMSETFIVTKPEPNVTAYKSRFFNFNNLSLQEIVKTLNSVYNTRIQVGENIMDCRITVSFKNESADEIATVIAETLGLSAVREKDVITLNGAGCGEPDKQ